MRPIPKEVIAAAIEVLGTDDISDDVIDARIAALVSEPIEARRLIDWIPEAFGMVAIAHLDQVVLPRTFQAKDSQGEWKQFPFECEPVFTDALSLAQGPFHNGPRHVFQAVASRSATIASVNNLAHAGKSLAGAVFSGPVLLGIPAEIYPKQLEHFWIGLGRRLGRWWYGSRSVHHR